MSQLRTLVEIAQDSKEMDLRMSLL